MGKLILNFATMKAGKTVDLLMDVHAYEENGQKILLLKPEIDKKAEDCVETRIGNIKKICDYLIPEGAKVEDIIGGKLDGVKCIYIDEAQFLSYEQVEELLSIAQVLDIDIVCYALRTNFRMKPFSGSVALLANADNINELSSKVKCSHCGERAQHVGRRNIKTGEYDTDGPEVVIDGSKEYIYDPLCTRCALELIRKVDTQELRRRLIYGKRESSD